MNIFWIAFDVVAALTTVGFCIRYFYRNHTFKKWLRLYEGMVVAYYGVIYILTLLGVLEIPTYSDFLRPAASVLLLIPLFEIVADRWRK